VEEEKHKVRSFAMTIKEEGGKYVITKDQLVTLLSHYRNLWALLNTLLEERQRLGLLLAEQRLKKLGIGETESYLN
jgi:hypothetical protein